MNEDYASYELAKKLKACGFNEPCDHYYHIKNGVPEDDMWFTHGSCADFNNYKRRPDDFVSVPFLWQAQKWLREKKGIYAYCEPNCLKKWFARAIDLAKNEDLLFDGEMFDSFEKATEYAISAVLELIKKGE